jgi:hypothetical protein
MLIPFENKHMILTLRVCFTAEHAFDFNPERIFVLHFGVSPFATSYCVSGNNLSVESRSGK